MGIDEVGIEKVGIDEGGRYHISKQARKTRGVWGSSPRNF